MPWTPALFPPAMHCADNCASSANGTLKTRPLSGVKNVPVYQGLCFLGVGMFFLPFLSVPILGGSKAHSSRKKGLRSHGDACLAASFVPLHVNRHAHRKGPLLYEWSPYENIASAVFCVGLSGMIQLDSRARFHKELQKEVTAKGDGVWGGFASRLAWSTFVALCQGQWAGAGCCLLEKGLGFSEHFRKLRTVPRGSLAELFQDELAFGLMDSPANTQTTGIYFHSWNKRIYST